MYQKHCFGTNITVNIQAVYPCSQLVFKVERINDVQVGSVHLGSHYPFLQPYDNPRHRVVPAEEIANIEHISGRA